MRDIPVFTLCLLVAVLGLSSQTLAQQAARSTSAGWTITQSASGNSFDTSTELVTIKNLTGPGLVSVKRSAGMETIMRWEAGGFGQTIEFNGQRVVDGRSLSDVSRHTGFKTNRAGDFVYLKTPKGPKARVQLYLNDTRIHDWPRLSVVRLIAYKQTQITVSVFDRDTQRTEFWVLDTTSERPAVVGDRLIGVVDGCSILKSKVEPSDILLQLYCDAENGSDVYRLDMASGQLAPLFRGGADALLAQGLLQKKLLSPGIGEVPVLLVDGTANARAFFHATTSSLLKDLGEPMSLGSDGAGKQSWSQSYRTRALAKLHQATGHKAFAALARIAMNRTLDQQNAGHGISGDSNPQCGWASRIYSTDKKTPISLLINQAMISGSLLSSCMALGGECPEDLKARVQENAKCLIESYESDFDHGAHLYRIQRGTAFRYDGIWAPWNWQMSWASVLAQAGDDMPGMHERAARLVDAFTASWTNQSDGALWRYWPDQFYVGWEKADGVSLNRPSQKPSTSPRFEDLNHAGISLLGLEGAMASGVSLLEDQTSSVRKRLQTLLASGTVLARDLDGQGPVSPRWMPGAGWEMFAGDAMRDRYAHVMPGAHSSDQHLAYARLFNPEMGFDLKLTLAYCSEGRCRAGQDWRFQSADAFLEANPLFAIHPLQSDPKTL